MESMYIEELKQIEDDKWAWMPILREFDLENDFGMDEDNLSAEICKMGRLMIKYGAAAAEQEANLKRKEEYAKLVKAQIAGAIRSDAEKNGAKMTENKLEEEVTVHAAYQTALSALHVLRADALKADYRWKTIVKKADLLNALAFRQNAEIKRMG